MSALHTPPVRLVHGPSAATAAGPLTWALCAVLAACGSPTGAPPAANGPSPLGAAGIPADGPTIQPPRALGPRLQMQPSGGLLHGRVGFRVVARDGQPIRSLRFVEPEPLVRALPAHRLDDEGYRAELRTSLATDLLDDGPLSVTVRAEGADGHVTLRTAEFYVANHGPQIVWVGLPDDRRIDGRWTLEARALDPNGVKSFAVVEPGFVDTAPAPDRLRVELDTRGWPEGPRTLTLEARDAHGHVSRSVETLIVDNAPPPVVDGSVWFGGPVAGMRVRAHAVEADGSDGQRLDACPDDGCPTGPGGRFEVPLAEERWGTVRFVAVAGDGAQAYDPTSDGVRPVPAGLVLSAAVDGTPGEAVRMHGITTLIDITAQAWIRDGEPTQAAFDRAAALWAEHVCEGCNAAAVEPVGAGAHRRLTPAVRLGLVHGGLSRLAAEAARGVPLSPRRPAITVWTLMAWLRSDLWDGDLDGSPGFRGTTDPFTLRSRLAGAIDALVESRPGWLEAPRGLLRGEAGWLEAMAARTSALWPERPAPMRLDVKAPAIEIVSPAPDSAHGPRAIELVATATDDGVPPTMHIVAPDDIRVWIGRSEPGRIEARLTVTNRAEGRAVITVIAEDAAGNVAEEAVSVRVDHSPPRLTLSDIDGTPIEPGDLRYTVAPSFAFLARVDDPEATVDTLLPSEVRPFGDAYVVAVRGYGDGRNPIEVIARDAAGNAGAARFTLERPGDRPRIAVEGVRFTPAGRHTARQVDCEEVDIDTGICDVELVPTDDPMIVHADTLVPGDRAPVELEVFPLPSEMYDAPSVNVAVWDETGRDQVEQRFVRRGGGWSPWAPVDMGPGRYALDLASPFGGAAVTESSVEHVQIRVTDGAGQQTTRGFTWRRVVVAPPISVSRSEDFAWGLVGGRPGLYDFEGEPGHGIEALVQPGIWITEDGIRLEKWRLYNPWPVPVVASVTGSVLAEQTRGDAYLVSGTMQTESRCAVGQFFRLSTDADPADANYECRANLAYNGTERIVARVGLAFNTEYERDENSRVPMPAAGIELAPGRHMVVYLKPPLAPFELLGEYGRDLERQFTWYQVRDGGRLSRFRAVERDVTLRWIVENVRVLTTLAGQPDDSARAWSEVPGITFTRVNPPIEMPLGIDLR